MSTRFSALGRCAQSDYYEAAVVRGCWLTISFEHQGRRCQERLLPVDLVTRNGEEWLLAESSEGRRQRIPLGAILRVDEFESQLRRGR